MGSIDKEFKGFHFSCMNQNSLVRVIVKKYVQYATKIMWTELNVLGWNVSMSFTENASQHG